MRELFCVPGEAPKRQNVVVVRAGGKQAGLVVDRLLGEFQTVIKPPGRLFNQTQGLSGFTILGSGEVALILDVAKLFDLSVHSEKTGYENMGKASKQGFLALMHDRQEGT